MLSPVLSDVSFAVQSRATKKVLDSLEIHVLKIDK
jgi:hypothetical protein